MDNIRKKLKEVPRKISALTARSPTPPLEFLPEQVFRLAEPEEENEPWRTDPYAIAPHPSYNDRTDHPGRLERTSKKKWKQALETKDFEVIAAPDTTTTFQHGFTYSDPFQFAEEKHDRPRRAPTVEEQKERYPPTHHADGTPILPAPEPNGYAPWRVGRAWHLSDIADGARAERDKRRAEDEEYREYRRQIRIEEESEQRYWRDWLRFEARYGHPPEWKGRAPYPPPKDRDYKKAMMANPPRLINIMKKPLWEDLTPEQQKDLLHPPVQPREDRLAKLNTPEQQKDLLSPPAQPSEDRHAKLKEKLAKAKAAKESEGRQPLENGFVNNSASTPVAGPSRHHRGDDEEAIIFPSKASNGGHVRSASVSQRPPVHTSQAPGDTPERLAKFKFGSVSRANEGSSSRRGDIENSVSTPPIDYSKHPLPPLPRQSRQAEATHARTPSCNAVYYTPQDMQHAAAMGSSSTWPQRAESMNSRTSSQPQPAPQPQRQQPIAGPSGSRVRSDSASSTKRNGTIGYPPTPPLKIHKRNPSGSSDSHSHSHTALDYAMASTSRAGPHIPGPPPVMRHRDLIDANPPITKRPGRLDSLPINTRSKNAKEEYFTPPPARVVIDPIDGSRPRLDQEFGVLPKRNLSTSSATAPPRLKGPSSHGHSQSLQVNTGNGLPAHPAVHIQERKIRRVKLNP